MAKLLVAEDDFAVRDFVRRALEMAGHDITSVHEGAEALQRVNAEGDHYDLLISDMRMPVIDGIALSKEVFKVQPSLRILFITGFSGVFDESELMPSVSGVLNKPFTVGQIQDAVQTALASQNKKMQSFNSKIAK